MDVLSRIKRCVLQGNLKFSLKARDEVILDGLSPLDVRESLVNATSIVKTMRSTSDRRASRREHLYVFIAPNLSGLMIYTKEICCGSVGRDLLSIDLQQAIVMTKAKVPKCPTCGSRRIRHVREDVTIHVGGISFVTPDVEFDDCPNCGEQIFDLAAMEKINAHRPSAARVKARKRKIA